MAAFYLARYCVIYATARGEQRGGRGGNELRKGMDGRQPRGKWNAGNIWNRLGLGEMAALWLVPPRQLPVVHPLSNIVSGLARDKERSANEQKVLASME